MSNELRIQNKRSRSDQMRFPIVEALVDDGRLDDVGKLIKSVQSLLKIIDDADNSAKTHQLVCDANEGLSITADFLNQLAKLANTRSISVG